MVCSTRNVYENCLNTSYISRILNYSLGIKRNMAFKQVYAFREVDCRLTVLTEYLKNAENGYIQ